MMVRKRNARSSKTRKRPRLFQFDESGSLTAELAVVAAACVIVIIIMSNVCLFLIRAAQFDRVCGEVARSCAYADAEFRAQEGIDRAMDLSQQSQFSVSGTESGGGVGGTKIVSFELVYQPLIPGVSIGRFSAQTPTFRRTKTFAVPAIGYVESSGP